MARVLRGALERALQLVRERGPLSPGQLVALLQEHGYTIDAGLLMEHVHGFPEYFAVSDEVIGPITAPTSEEAHDDVDAHTYATADWPTARSPTPIPPDAICVLDVETTGLSIERDRVWEIAVTDFYGHLILHELVRVPDTLLDRVPEAQRALLTNDPVDSLRRLSTTLARFEAIAGHNLRAFDVEILKSEASRPGVALDIPAQVLDTLELSLVLLPTIPNRTLAALTHLLRVDASPNHRALDDAHATAACLRELVAMASDDAPGLPRALWALDLAEHPLGNLLAHLQRPADTREPSTVVASPLLEPSGDTPRDSVAGIAAKSLKRLGEAHGFSPRGSQTEMLHNVADAISEGHALAIEAPTGTGKTLAYLLPAIAHAATTRQPVVIATATKALQAQLAEEAGRLAAGGLLPVPFRQLLGIGNYVCARELDRRLEEGLDTSAAGLATAVAIRSLAGGRGVWDDVTDFTIRSRSLDYARTAAELRTTAAECERTNCEHRDFCPAMRQIDGIDRNPGVIATNHALIASWVGNDNRSPGNVLAEGKANLVLDEGHQAEDTFTAAWTETLDRVSFAVILGMLRGRRGPIRIAQALARSAGLGPQETSVISDIRQEAAELDQAAAALTSVIETYLHEYGGERATTVLTTGLTRRRQEFRAVSQAAATCVFRVERLQQALKLLNDEVATWTASGPSADKTLKRRYGQRSWAIELRLAELAALLESLRSLPDEQLWVHQLGCELDADRKPGPWSYQRLPIHIAPQFRRGVADRARSFVLTSATLTVEKKFDFVASRLGLDLDVSADRPLRTKRLRPVFDYRAQSRVVLTSHLPIPVPVNEREFCEELARDQVGLFSLTGGRGLTLFAARRRMNIVAHHVREHAAALEARGVRLMVQGEAGPNQLRDEFRRDPGTVLYGARTYWEGFDAPGETLQYLTIEKAPYPTPDDPLISARQRALSDLGRDGFTEYILPLTAMRFVQGFGRLIRTETDRGAALVCDRRLQLPSTARRVLLDSLPDPDIVESDDRADAWTKAIEFVTGVAPDLSAALIPATDYITDILTQLTIDEASDPTASLLKAAELVFGISELRPEQLELMLANLAGRDALGILPTGFGKSLCFQLPALLRGGGTPTIVISPLIALIKDQVDDLRSRRGIRSVHGITPSTPAAQRTEILRDLKTGKIRLLYLSPERFVRDPVLRRALVDAQLGSVVIDEAHCVSVWGADFRPEFRQIPAQLADHSTAPRMALTATATRELEVDITESTELRDPLVVRRASGRDNLRFTVRRVANTRERARELLRIAASMKGAPGIVYVTRRVQAEEVAALLRRAGHNARHFHAGMVQEQRDAVQDDFLADTTQIIVATKAFGMGINKPDIRWVVHYGIPEAVDAYVQEAGRAARDASLIGECVLLYTRSDHMRLKHQATRRTTKDDAAVAQKVLGFIKGSPTRNGDHLVDFETLAKDLNLESDELNVIVARLERGGNIRRHPDAVRRASVQLDTRAPRDPDERERFDYVMTIALKATLGARRLFDVDDVAARSGLDPDRLEQDLIDWSLNRMIGFGATLRAWRLQVLDPSFHSAAYEEEARKWRDWHTTRAAAISRYAESSICRRASIAAYFGDDLMVCEEGHSAACDICSGDAALWDSVDDRDVPDPEEIVDVARILLQAVAWTSRYDKGDYGKNGLLAALEGREELGGRPIGRGLLNCPQFGAVRYVRGAQKRLDAEVEKLSQQGLIRSQLTSRDGVAYESLKITDAGLTALGLVHA